MECSIFKEPVGLIVAGVISCFVNPQKYLKKKTAITLTPPEEGVSEKSWKALVEPKDRAAAGKCLGTLERILALVSFYFEGYTLIAGWLVFKVGCKWEVWSHVIQVPKTLENTGDLSYLTAREKWGSVLLSRFLIGTLANILIGFVLAYGLKLVLGKPS